MIAEDAHWLDRPTADALAFVGRRIESDPIVLIAALREGYDSPLSQAGLPELRLDRLAEEASARLLDQAFPGLSSVARERALTEAEGNPLALRELAVALGPGGRAADAAMSPRLPLTLRLEEAFAARAAELQAPARTLVRVAATAEDGLLATVLAGAEIIDGAPRTIEDLIRPSGRAWSRSTASRSGSATRSCSRRSTRRPPWPSGTRRTRRSPGCSPTIPTGASGTGGRPRSAGTRSSPLRSRRRDAGRCGAAPSRPRRSPSSAPPGSNAMSPAAGGCCSLPPRQRATSAAARP